MVTIEEFRRHLTDSAMSRKTVEAYASGMASYMRLFDSLNTENVQEYKRICLQKHKPKTVNLRLHALASYARWQKLDVSIRTVRIQEPLFAESPMTPRDYQRIMGHLSGKGQWDWYVLLRTLACTGMRISESHQLTVGDLRLSKKVIVGKGGKTRVVWFPLNFRKEVLPLLAGLRDSDPVVRHKDNYIRTKLMRLKTELHLNCTMSPHEFRRFYARQVYARTKDVHLVKDLLGHANIATTMKYLRTSVSNVSRRMSRIVDW